MSAYPTVPALPTLVATMRKDLEASTGQTPGVRRTSPLYYQLRLTSERVDLTITWRRRHNGSWKRNTSTLTVDGIERPPARGLDDFTRIWNDPDVFTRPNGRSEVPELRPVSDEAELPDVVRGILDKLRSAPRVNGNIETLAAATDDGYTVELTGPKGTLHLHFVRTRGAADSWGLPSRRAFRIFDTDGTDTTSKFAGDLKAAMKAMFGLDAAPAVPGQTGHARQARVTNSVQVRSHAVIRV
ncbi:hypothetical protein [Streptomyces sp. NPDC048272]|uniref:hypothetical protein n=1 Tax=Streptomyces sp. NPDC048272 TaxID=3154616 RepID=UPI0034489D37